MERRLVKLLFSNTPRNFYSSFDLFRFLICEWLSLIISCMIYKGFASSEFFKSFFLCSINCGFNS